MSDLIRRKKIRDYIKGEINPYGKPFEGTAYELGLKIMRYIDAMDSDYDIDKDVAELKCDRCESCSFLEVCAGSICCGKCHEKAIEIVKQGGVAVVNNATTKNDYVCEWRLCDEEANVYDTSCRNPHILIEGTPRENNYEFCPYCGKNIKVVE